MFFARFVRRRRGSIAVVIVFATMMAIVVLGMFRVGTTLYASDRNNEKGYAEIQTMEAVAQIGCYRYVNDLMALSAEKVLEDDMPGTPQSVVYSDCVEDMWRSIGTAEDPYIWNVRDINTVMNGLAIANPDILLDTISKLTGVVNEFTLHLEEDLILDFSSEDAYLGTTDISIPLRPVKVEVVFAMRGQRIVEHYEVEGLILKGEIQAFMDGPDMKHRVHLTISDQGIGNEVHIYGV